MVDSRLCSTKEIALGLFERMSASLAVVRRRLRRPLTLSEKILFSHLEDPLGQELAPLASTLRLRPDRVVLQDVLGQTAFLQFMQTGRKSVAVPTTIHCDHLIRAKQGRERDLAIALAENEEVYSFLRRASSLFGAGFFEPGEGIIHQVVLENLAFPGSLLIGTDSHTPNAGGLGTCAVGVGGADAVEVMVGLPLELLHPRRIAVVLEGALDGWAAPKDVIIHLVGRLGTTGATNAIVEYIGAGARTLSTTGKATIANMGAEMGATTSLFPFDPRGEAYLSATGRADLAKVCSGFREILEPDPEVEALPERFFDEILHVDLSALEPHVSGPHSPDRVRPLSQLTREAAQEETRGPLQAALVGSCTNSSYADLGRAADVARQALARGLRAIVPFFIAPGSERVRATAERDGFLEPLRQIGGVELASACGPCIGQWERAGRAEGPSAIVSSFNRNFPGRNDGRRDTLNFLMSPELVTALAIAGRLNFDPMKDALLGSDNRPFRFDPPRPPREVPEQGFEGPRRPTLPPVEDGGKPLIEETSERLQVMAPWPRWDGADLVGLPVLVKVSGSATTDQISPAGAWLRYRGHLERFSENLLSGVVNASSGEVGTGLNLLTGTSGEPLFRVARHYRSAGLRWVIVGERNYGEGSSREHAALVPRLLGCAAVVAKSFARIHETNLKKQGLLPLRFREERDYERFRERDRVSLMGLAELAPGCPLSCLLRHDDGTSETLLLDHSFTVSQVEWFRAGSALASAKDGVVG